MKNQKKNVVGLVVIAMLFDGENKMGSNGSNARDAVFF